MWGGTYSFGTQLERCPLGQQHLTELPLAMKVARCPAPIEELHIRPRWPEQARPESDTDSDSDEDEYMNLGGRRRRLPPEVGGTP